MSANMVSCTTHIVCAKCGADIEVNSENDGPLRSKADPVTGFTGIFLDCPECGSSYRVQIGGGN